MFKKRMFIFCLLLNVIFYLGTAAALFWHQSVSLKNDVRAFYKKQTAVIESELEQRSEFYHHWLQFANELPKSPKEREVFLRMNNIDYLGYFWDNGIVHVSANKQPPPFADPVLRANTGSLFHRNKENLFFSYTYAIPFTGPTYLISVKEDPLYFIRRLTQIGSHIVVLEKARREPVNVLFSNLGPKLTEELVKGYPLGGDLKERSPDFTLSEDDYYILPIPLFKNDDFQQVLLVIFNRSQFFFSFSMSVAVLLLALFCTSSLLLMFGYLRSKEQL